MKQFCGRLFRKFIRINCAVFLTVFYRLRIEGRENIPIDGPVLIASNHQSFFDPVVVGVAGWPRRHFYAMARATLFRNILFSTFIRALNARPVQQGVSDIKAMRFALDLMKQGESMLIFPEGSRTETGQTLEFKSGMMLLVKRGNAMIVPTAVEGAFEAWPRNRSFPKLFGRIGVKFGKPISAEQMLALPAEEALEDLRQKVETLRLEIAEQNCNR